MEHGSHNFPGIPDVREEKARGESHDDRRHLNLRDLCRCGF